MDLRQSFKPHEKVTKFVRIPDRREIKPTKLCNLASAYIPSMRSEITKGLPCVPQLQK